MTSEQQEGYRALIETGGPLGGPRKIWVHDPKLAKATGPLARIPPGRILALRARDRPHHATHTCGMVTFVFADHGTWNMSRDTDRSALPVHGSRSVVGREPGRASAQTAID